MTTAERHGLVAERDGLRSEICALLEAARAWRGTKPTATEARLAEERIELKRRRVDELVAMLWVEGK